MYGIFVLTFNHLWTKSTPLSFRSLNASRRLEMLLFKVIVGSKVVVFAGLFLYFILKVVISVRKLQNEEVTSHSLFHFEQCFTI